MNPMTLDEFYSVVGEYRRDKYGPYCTEVIKKFTSSGYEAVEITPEDLHTDSITTTKVPYIRKKLKITVDALKLEQVVGVRSSGGHVYLFRMDI